MSTIPEAKDARDALIAKLDFHRIPHPTIVGIGIAKEGESYVVSVAAISLVDLPSAVLGVPVRVHLSGRPVPQKEPHRMTAAPTGPEPRTDAAVERCRDAFSTLYGDRRCDLTAGHEGHHVRHDGCGRPEYYWGKP